MGRPEKPINASSGAVAAFASELRRLRALAGNPTYRDMARSALYSPSVLSSAASGHRLPTLQVTLAFVAACGGDQEVWRRRWLEVCGDPPPRPPSPPP
ncbi:helix-turn-helix domain-containing protein, partial [Actinomadura soli]